MTEFVAGAADARIAQAETARKKSELAHSELLAGGQRIYPRPEASCNLTPSSGCRKCFPWRCAAAAPALPLAWGGFSVRPVRA